MLAASECVVLSRWTCAEKGDHRTTLQGCPLERQRCAMAAFSGLLSLLWSGRAQGSEGRAGLGGAVHRTLTAALDLTESCNRSCAVMIVNDRPSRLFSAEQEAPAYPRVGTGSSVSPWLNFGCRDAVFGRSMKCHPVEGGRPSPTPSFSLRSGSTARTVGCSPVPCPQPPRRARSTTSAISGD